jgi:hypothetical protein
MFVRTRLVGVRGLAWKLGIPVACLVAAQLALTGAASATHTVASGHRLVATQHNMLDCNATFFERLCTDPHGPIYNGHVGRFTDPITHQYVGHDEPSVKFISSRPGSGNTMTYTLQLPTDPKKAPTPNGSVTDYAELSAAPWFGLGICDPKSYPQNPCKPLSDSNVGTNTPNAAGAAFMELQWYPPGLAPGDGFVDSTSCSKTQWCAALTIDSLMCTFNFTHCNNNCIEPVNFAFMQTNGVPPGPPNPQRDNVGTWFGNRHTLKMNSGDKLTASISNTPAGLKASVTDLTTHQTGFIVASAKNGFQNTSIKDCSGKPFGFHAEYNTAKQQNQTPWAALEGGVLMQQEIGHGESCSSVTNKLSFSMKFTDGSSFSDPQVFQTCAGGIEGRGKTGEGGCNPTTAVCQHATTQGMHGPVACPVKKFNSGALCEFSDGRCFPKGNRPFFINGNKTVENSPVAFCIQNAFENGDLDFEGNSYIPDWPNGSKNFPTSFRYTGPFTNGHRYPSIQFETDAAASESLCNVATGVRCTAPPIGAKFYPYWTLTKKNAKPGVCVWNFGSNIAGVTTNDFGKAAQYGKPDVARFGGTLTSKVMPNPEFLKNCGK